MLAPAEFTVGALSTASPLSLVLPRGEGEATIIVGQVDGAAAAVFLSGEWRFHFFPSAENAAWRGLVVPNVRIEVDEANVFDADRGTTLGAVVRTDTRLIVQARGERSFGQTAITLHDGLEKSGEQRAGFTKWQIVVGQGPDKRVLHTVDLSSAGRG